MRRDVVAAAGAGLVTIAVLAGVTAMGAPVGPINPLDPALGFNLFIEGDATLISNEAEGPAAIGGNLTIGGIYNVSAQTAGTHIAPGDDQPTGLVVGGRLDFAASNPAGIVRVLNGYVHIADLTGAVALDTDGNGAAVNTRVVPEPGDYDSTPRVELAVRQDADTVGADSGVDFSGAFDSFRTISTDLASCANNVQLTDAAGAPLESPYPTGTNAFLSLTPGVTNVLNISAADLNQLSVLTFTSPPTADTPLLINVDTSGVADNFDWSSPNLAGISGPDGAFILWNFPTAERIHHVSGDTVIGSIYAPNAELVDDNPSNIEGQIVAQSASLSSGEVHHFPFNAVLSCPDPTPSVTPTPSVSPSASPSTSPSTTASPSLSPSPSTTPTPSLTPSMSTSPSPSVEPSGSSSPSELLIPSTPGSAGSAPGPDSGPTAHPVTGIALRGFLTAGIALTLAGAAILLGLLLVARRNRA